MAFVELDVVRVVALRAVGREFTGTEGVARAPAIDDVGCVVHVYHGHCDAAYIVEAVDADGMTVWIADFDADELALAVRDGASR